jgi:hypothetical protein
MCVKFAQMPAGAQPLLTVPGLLLCTQQDESLYLHLAYFGEGMAYENMGEGARHGNTVHYHPC